MQGHQQVMHCSKLALLIQREDMTALPSVVTPPAGSAAPGTAGKALLRMLLAGHAEVEPTPCSHNSCWACFLCADAPEASPVDTHQPHCQQMKHPSLSMLWS